MTNTQNSKISQINAYKLLRLRIDGSLGPLFVGRTQVFTVGNWMNSREDLPHPGLAHRPGFHCCSTQKAPHIKLKLKNGEQRVWCSVSIEKYESYKRPECQGGLWYVAKRMKINEIIIPHNSNFEHKAVQILGKIEHEIGDQVGDTVLNSFNKLQTELENKEGTIRSHIFVQVKNL